MQRSNDRAAMRTVALRALVAVLAVTSLTIAPAGLPSAAAEDPPAVVLGRAVATLAKDAAATRSLLEPLLGKFDLLEDYVLFYLARSLEKTEPAKARGHYESILRRHLSSPLVMSAAARLARLRAAAGDRAGVAALAERYTANEPASLDKAHICLAAARSSLKTHPAQSAVFATCARRHQPRSAAAADARELLARLRKSHPELSPRSAEEIYDEAMLVGREGDHKGQAKLLSEFLERFRGHAKAPSATLAHARSLARPNGKKAAAEYLEERAGKTNSQPDKARYLYAAAGYRWNDDDDEGALALFTKVLDLKAGIAEEQRAHYAIGRIHESAGRFAPAVAAYGEAAKGKKAAEKAEGRWRQGWTHFTSGDYRKAADTFAKLASTAPRGSVSAGRSPALYWRARSLERLGQKDAAEVAYRRVLDEFPDGYYAYAVERRTALRARKPETAVLERVDPGDLSAAARRAWQRAEALRAAGLQGAAARDLALNFGRLGTAEKRRLLPLLGEVGADALAYHAAQHLHHRGALGSAELSGFLYPLAYRDMVTRAAAAHRVDPFLVYSLMRQESAYDANAVSPAQALGLMQLLESTASRMASAAGLTGIERQMLFDADTNIRLGTAYLAELAERFDGDPVLMLAAYNAGETPAERWQKNAGHLDEDEMIERISYRETRDYVKKVLRNLRNYRRAHPVRIVR